MVQLVSKSLALSSVLVSLLSCVQGAPTKSRPLLSAPITHAGDISGAKAASPPSYIISLESKTVDPQGRGEWLDSVLLTGGHTKRSHIASELRLEWNEAVFNGFAGQFSDAELRTLSSQPEVQWIQQDILVHTTAVVQQGNAPWGLSRLSTGGSPLPEGSIPTDLTFTYSFDETAGSGVDIYFLDTGVRSSHQDFAGRANFLQTFGGGATGTDVNGHGTHIAGIAAGSVFGVAKSASINMIKCMADDGSGTTSDIISGINLAATTATSSGRPSVVSMSLGGSANQAIDDAVTNAVNMGIPFIVAAGNESVDASTNSPARLGGPNGNPGVITVGATTITDQFASFSNFGANIDILAPGQDILSCGVASDDAVDSKSGTSMSTPHIAGLAALIMGQAGKLSPADLKQRLLSQTVSGVIIGIPSGTANVLGAN